MPRTVRRTHERTKEDNKILDEKIMETVNLRKPFGLRINKHDLRVTLVEPRGSSIGQVGVGDTILAINRNKLKTIKDLNRQLKMPGQVQIRIELFPDMDLSQELGLSVKYDNKEQLQVASVVPGSLASVHLRPGDIIRKINGQYITSKTMLAFWMRHGLDKDKEIRILVETGVEGDSHIEMPEDVQQIAQRQLSILKSMKAPKVTTSLTKRVNPTGAKHVVISKEESKEMGICSDYDETTLKHVRKDR